MQWKEEASLALEGGAELLEFRNPNEFVSTAPVTIDSLGFTVGFPISPLK